MKYIKRLLVMPFVVIILLISQLFWVVKASWHMLRHGYVITWTNDPEPLNKAYYQQSVDTILQAIREQKNLPD